MLVLIILAGDIEMNPGPRPQCRQCKNIVRRQTRLPSVRNVENASMCHVQILVRKNCKN